MKSSLTSFARCLSLRLTLGALILVCPGLLLVGTAQEKVPSVKETPKSPYKLNITKGDVTGFSLKAKDAPLADIAGELSSRLKTRVLLSKVMEKELITLEFRDLTLEPALKLLAPQVYIDYEIDLLSGVPPRPVGIFLYGYNEPPPPLNAVVVGNTQGMLIEGDTEEGVEPTTEEAKKRLEERPVRVSFEENYLSVKAKHERLTLVLLEIGEELGIPVEIQNDTTEIVDLNIVKVSLEEALRRLSPNIRLFSRLDLQTQERLPLRLVLLEPPKTDLPPKGIAIR